MKLAVLSDIHANREALERVLEDLDAVQPDHIVCLGDCIGYGPDPQAVIETLRSRDIPSLIGNHELAALDPSHLSWFNPRARRSLELTLPKLSTASMDFIRRLPRSLILEGCRFVHGFPPESARTYLFQKSEFELLAAFHQMAERLCFVGHTHDLEIVQFDGAQVQRRPLPPGPTQLTAEYRYIINVGSVGQPRDGTNQAKYLIWDRDGDALDVRSIAYDIQAVVNKILAAGLPKEHANRLW